MCPACGKQLSKHPGADHFLPKDGSIIRICVSRYLQVTEPCFQRPAQEENGSPCIQGIRVHQAQKEFVMI